MRQSGVKTASANPNNEQNQLKQELIEHYKNNKARAEQLIKTVEANGEAATSSPIQRLHYEAAVVAIRGYQPLPTTTNSTNVPSVPQEVNRETELNRLKQAGWVPLVH